MKKIIGSHLNEDIRVRTKPGLVKNVYSDDAYEIEIRVYPGAKGNSAYGNELMTAAVLYKEEDLEIEVKILVAELKGKFDEGVKMAVKRIEGQEKGRFHLIHDAKKWCRIPYTHKDRARMIAAGINYSDHG